MLPIHLRHFIKHNVLTTAEAAEILEVTRQSVIKYVREGELIPVKESSQGSLFLRTDVEALKRKKIYGLNPFARIEQPFLVNESGITREALSFFEENIDRLDDIVAIFIYFNPIDSVIDNFFEPAGFQSYGDLQYVNNPYFVLRDINGQEMWLGGVNCGYGGEGPHGSERILKRLGIPEDLVSLVFKYRVVKFIKDLDTNEWDKVVHNGLIESDNDVDSVNLYLFRGNLVLVQDPHILWRDNLEGIFQTYKAFIRNPVEAIIFSNHEQAREQGYISLTHFGVEETYSFIIRDLSGRELWLRPVITDEPLRQQTKLTKILEACGFDIPQETIVNRMLSWLSTINLRTAEPIYLKKKNTI